MASSTDSDGGMTTEGESYAEIYDYLSTEDPSPPHAINVELVYPVKHTENGSSSPSFTISIKPEDISSKSTESRRLIFFIC